MTALREVSRWSIVVQTAEYASDTWPGFALQNWWRYLDRLLGIGEEGRYILHFTIYGFSLSYMLTILRG